MHQLRFPAISCLVFAAGAMLAQTPQYPFQNVKLGEEQRIDNLLSVLTLEEKISLFGDTLDIPRVGIHGADPEPTLTGSYGQFEGLQGVAMRGVWARRAAGTDSTPDYPKFTPIPTTQFSQPNGLGQTWDPELVRAAAAQEAFEARYIFQSYDRGGLLMRAPNADLVRDPRWGRSEESYGEDAFLDGTLATAFSRGLQGDDPHYWTTVSIAKHFFANSNEDNRESDSSNFDETLLHDYYSKPFRMAIEGAGTAGLMVAFNAVNGTPMTANPLVPQLTSAWHFRGIIDTDRDAMNNLVTKHHVYPDLAHAVTASLHNGVNTFLDVKYNAAVHAALAQGLLTETDLNTDLRPVLHALLKLGVLDAPGTPNPYTHIRKGSVPVPWTTDAAKQLALRATLESVVLLKNDAMKPAGAPLLPIDSAKVHSIAVLGPAADKLFIGGYTGTTPFAITPLDGIRGAAGTGVDVQTAATHDDAVRLAAKSDVAVVFVGNDPDCNKEKFGTCSDTSGGREAIDRKRIALPDDQERLVEDVYAANPRTIVVVVSSFPFSITWEQAHVPSILHIAHSSEQEGAALAEVLFGKYNPAGRLSVTWPAALSDLPPMMDYNLRDGRTYMYAKAAPLYPFGFGLSYTTFRFSHLRLSSRTLSDSGKLMVTVDVTNTGDRAGDEVVQLYVQHVDSKVPRPHEELEGFSRVSLSPNQTRTVNLSITASQLATWNEATHSEELEHDHLRILVGDSSVNLPLQQTIAVAP